MALSARLLFTVVCLARCVRGAPSASESERANSASADASAPDRLVVPNKTTAADALAPEGSQHVELLRLRRNFGKQNFEIVLDAWTPIDQPTTIDEVRFWWFKTHKEGERGPFSRKTSRHFDIAYERRDAGHWQVQIIASKGKRFTFHVRADPEAGIAAYSSVVLPSGERVEDCRIKAGELRATKLLGMTTGIEALRVTCVDGSGTERKGDL